MKKIIESLLFLAVLAVFLYLAWGKLGAFFYNQGNKYFEQSLYAKAIESYGNAVKINGQSTIAHLGLAEAYRENQNYDQAVVEYNKVLSLDPLSVKA